MKFGGKDFQHYWKIIKIPVFVLIGWSVLGFILSIISFDVYTTIFSSLSGIILLLAVFGFTGWTAVKEYKTSTGIAAWAGALTGAISGFAGAIISILMFFIVPEVILAAAAQSGVDPTTLQGIMRISIFLGLITGPLFSGLIGAGITAIAALISKKI